MKIFISYARVDQRNVKDWIVDKLETICHEVWLDEQIVGGQDWKRKLKEEIENCDAFIYCMTPESVASTWCKWELAYATELGKQVIPVLIQAQTQIPEQLKKLQFIDFSNGPTDDGVAELKEVLKESFTILLRRWFRCYWRWCLLTGIFTVALILICLQICKTLPEPLQVFRNDGSITLFVPEHQTINLDDWSWGRDSDEQQRFSSYRTFGRGERSGPACFTLEYQFANPSELPEVCLNLENNAQIVEEVVASDVFWYSENFDMSLEITIFVNDTVLATCAPEPRDCVLPAH